MFRAYRRSFFRSHGHIISESSRVTLLGAEKRPVSTSYLPKRSNSPVEARTMSKRDLVVGASSSIGAELLRRFRPEATRYACLASSRSAGSAGRTAAIFSARNDNFPPPNCQSGSMGSSTARESPPAALRSTQAANFSGLKLNLSAPCARLAALKPLRQASRRLSFCSVPSRSRPECRITRRRGREGAVEGLTRRLPRLAPASRQRHRADDHRRHWRTPTSFHDSAPRG